MKFLLAVAGALVAGSIVSALGVQSAAFRALAAAIGMGAGWIVHGTIEQRSERARIARELDGGSAIKSIAGSESSGVGPVLLSQSGVTVFLLIFSLFASMLLSSMSAVLFILAPNDTFFSWVLIIIGCLFLIPFIKGCFRKIHCYENGIFVRNLWRRGFVAFNEICALRYYALSKSTNGIPRGTSCVLEIVPLHERTLKFEVFGTTGDSRKTWSVVLLARQMNPEIEMRQY